MSQNNALSVKVQNILNKFIDNNRYNKVISRTDIMKYVIVSLYAQMPDAKEELVAPFRSCVHDLHNYFTQEEIDAIMPECSKAIMYCLRFSEKMGRMNFDDDSELAEEKLSEDAPLNIYKTPECVIDLCMRLSGSRRAGEKVYMPYSDFADYPLYCPEAEYRIESEDCSCGDEEPYGSYTNAYAQLLLDSQGVNPTVVYGDCSIKSYAGMGLNSIDYIFACNPTLNQKCHNTLSVVDGMWNSPQQVGSFELGQNISLWLLCLKPGGSLDVVLPQSYFQEKGLWQALKALFESQKMELNATFITLRGSLFDCDCGDMFLLHIEKDKGNVGMIRLINATGAESYKKSSRIDEWIKKFEESGYDESIMCTYPSIIEPNEYQNGWLDVDHLMDIVNQEVCDAKFEERMHYTKFFGEGERAPHQHLIDKKLPELAQGQKYITLKELVTVESAVVEEECMMRVMGDETLSSEYMNCNVNTESLQKKKLNEQSQYVVPITHRYVGKDCLVAGLVVRYFGVELKVGRFDNVKEPIAFKENIIAFSLKSKAVTEDYLLRELVKGYCSIQARMLAFWNDEDFVIAPEDFLNIKIAVPSLEEQERQCKEDARANLREAGRKLLQTADEFNRDVHMKKHAIGQTVFNLKNWWDMLQKVRKEGGGIVDDTTEIGKVHKIRVSEIYDNIQTTMEKLNMQVDRFWIADKYTSEDLSLTAFIKEYVKEHQNALFTYEMAFPNGNIPQVSFSKDALAMVFDNIISNACSHGFDNQASADNNIVRISIDTSNGRPCVVVANNGKPFHDKLTVEDVFTYGRSSKNGQKHYGIGGYEVWQLMKKFGGDAEFVSSPDEKFTVSYRLTFNDISNK